MFLRVMLNMLASYANKVYARATFRRVGCGVERRVVFALLAAANHVFLRSALLVGNYLPGNYWEMV
jgi:hypothetical protein